MKKNKQRRFMQKTVLDEIIKSEKEAEAVIQEARNMAAEIISKADAEYNSSIASSREENQKKIQNDIHDAQKKADEAFQSAIEQAEKENSDFFAMNEKRTDSVSQAITDKILKPEYEKE